MLPDRLRRPGRRHAGDLRSTRFSFIFGLRCSCRGFVPEARPLGGEHRRSAPPSLVRAPIGRVPRSERLALDGGSHFAPRSLRYKMNSLQKHFCASELNNSFRRNLRKFRHASSAGIDAVGLFDFEQDLSEQIEDISNRILSNTYTHSRLKAFSFIKDGGKVRWICVPTIRDRLVQRKLAEVILSEDRTKLETAAGFGALKKLGAEGELSALDVAIQMRGQNQWVVKSDIAAFFDSLARSDAREAVRKVCRKRSLYPMIDQVINAEAAANSHTRRAMAEAGIIRGRGLRQGMPLSPLLAHIALIDFDRAMNKSGVKFVRYVDDLLFFGPNKKDVMESFYIAKKWLLEHRALSLPEIGHKKSAASEPLDFVEFLGLDIYFTPKGYRIRIPKSNFKALSVRFSERAQLKLSDPNPNAVINALKFLSSARKSYAGVYKKNR